MQVFPDEDISVNPKIALPHCFLVLRALELDAYYAGSVVEPPVARSKRPIGRPRLRAKAEEGD